MAQNDIVFLSAGKTIVILTVVVACLSILWPKIFYPMFQAAMSTMKDDTNFDILINQPPAMSPKFKDGLNSKPFPVGRREQLATMARGADTKSTKSQGPLGVFMPFYTLALLAFFIFTIFKLVTKREEEEEEENGGNGDERETSPDLKRVSQAVQQKDFHLDSEYRKFIMSEKYDEKGRSIRFSSQITNDNHVHHHLQKKHNENTIASGAPDEVVFTGEYKRKYESLRIRLAEREAKMESLLKSINAVSSKLVRAGILPSIPGLFSAPSDITNDSRKSECNRTDQSSKLNDAHHDDPMNHPVSKFKGLERLLLSRTQKTPSYSSSSCHPPLTTYSVSNALRTLIGNMEQFKTYLIQVEDCRSKLAQLEKAQRATEQCLRISHKYQDVGVTIAPSAPATGSTGVPESYNIPSGSRKEVKDFQENSGGGIVDHQKMDGDKHLEADQSGNHPDQKIDLIKDHQKEEVETDDHDEKEAIKDSEDDEDWNERGGDADDGDNGELSESDDDFDEDSEAIESVHSHQIDFEESDDELKLLNREEKDDQTIRKGYNDLSLTPDDNEIFHEFHGDTTDDDDEE